MGPRSTRRFNAAILKTRGTSRDCGSYKPPCGTTLRKAWKEVGLGGLNLVLLVTIIILAQLWLRKHGTPLLGAATLALFCFAVYAAVSKWIERRSPLPARLFPSNATQSP
jgi:hypothetical protein